MIKLEKNAVYYNKSNYLKTCRIESIICYNMDEALQKFTAADPRYYINKKDISIIEEVNLYYKTDLGVKRYYKTIDPTDETIETNYIIKD